MDSTPPLRQRIYEMLMESQYWPPEQMLEFQRSQLAQLLRHAKATVPFYKTRLDPVFSENGNIDWNRWHEIPILTRADLRTRRTELLAQELPPGHGPTRDFSTSGSSGVPITVTATSIASVKRSAAHASVMRTLHTLDAHEMRPRSFFPSEFKDWEQVFSDGKHAPIAGIADRRHEKHQKVSTRRRCETSWKILVRQGSRSAQPSPQHRRNPGL